MQNLVEQFLSTGPYAVVGASKDRAKYGNKVLRTYLQNKLVAYPVHPKASSIEDQTAYPSLAELPETVEHISIITPPHITESIVKAAGENGAKILWMQPGSESDSALQCAKDLGLQVIHGGPCVLVMLRFREDA